MSGHKDVLPLESLLSSASFMACGTVAALSEAWERPFRHNQGIQLRALSHAIGLDGLSNTLLAPSGVASPPEARVTQQYELRAGILVVRHVLPYSDEERRILAAHRGYFYEQDFQESLVGSTQAELGRRWHRWLWRLEDDPASRRRQHPSFDATMLQEACGRIRDALAPAVDQQT